VGDLLEHGMIDEDRNTIKTVAIAYTVIDF
jgi:hypothetical protein